MVGCFFFLSGYGLSYSLISKGKSYLDNFFSKRLAKLLPAFLLLTIVAILYHKSVRGESISDIAKDMYVNGNPPLFASWFVYALLILYCLYFISAYFSKSPLQAGIILSILTFAYMVFFRAIGFGWTSAAPAFPLGYFAAYYQKHIIAALRQHNILIHISLVLGLIASAMLADYRHNLFQPLESTIIPLIMYVLLLQWRIPQFKVLLFLGTISWEIYLMQGLMFTFSWNIAAIFAFVIIYPTTIIGAYMLWRVLSKSSGKSALKAC